MLCWKYKFSKYRLDLRGIKDSEVDKSLIRQSALKSLQQHSSSTRKKSGKVTMAENRIHT